MTIALTGATGFLGWHLRCAMKAEGIDYVPLGRADLEDHHALTAALAHAKVVIHAAGMNRGEDDELAATNLGLAERLAKAVAAHPSPPRVVYLNSTHIDRDTVYGSSKRNAARLLAESADLVDLVLPGVFGERGRPYYNSVVATFCHQLATGEALSIRDDAELELLHAQDAADLVLAAAAASNSGQRRPPGTRRTVAALADGLRQLHATYAAGVLPDLSDPFDRALFNTLRSYLYPASYPTVLASRSDERGTLLEVVKARSGGQMFTSTTVPGASRGNHFHRRKVERFAVVGGEAVISVRRLYSDDVLRFEVSGARPAVIDIPTLHTHDIVNTGAEVLTTLFWADEIFDPTHPDTWREVV